jgi:hypothetical protein
MCVCVCVCVGINVVVLSGCVSLLRINHMRAAHNASNEGNEETT